MGSPALPTRLPKNNEDRSAKDITGPWIFHALPRFVIPPTNDILGYGQIYVDASDSGTVTISGTTSYVEMTEVTWTFSNGAPGLEDVDNLFDHSRGNGRLTYRGTRDAIVLALASFSWSGAAASKQYHFRIGKNGVTDPASESQRLYGATNSRPSSSQVMLKMTQDDYISLWVRNSTSANNITLECANLLAVALMI